MISMTHKPLSERIKDIADALMMDISDIAPWVEQPAMETVNSMILRINQIKYLSDGFKGS